MQMQIKDNVFQGAKSIPALVKKYGYNSQEDLVQDALKHWILKLQEEEFIKAANRMRGKMRDKGVTEEEILRDFEKSSSS